MLRSRTSPAGRKNNIQVAKGAKRIYILHITIKNGIAKVEPVCTTGAVILKASVQKALCLTGKDRQDIQQKKQDNLTFFIMSMDSESHN